MQAAATILISLGADMANAGQISSGQAVATGISFAQSFDESAAQIIEARPQIAENEMPVGEGSSKAGVLIKNVGAIVLLSGSDGKAAAGAGFKLVTGTEEAKSSSASNPKVPTSAPGNVKAKPTENGLLSKQEKPKALIPAVIQMESTGAQAASDTTEAPALEPLSTIPTDEADATGPQAVASQADVAALADSSAQSREDILPVQNQEPILIPGEKQDDLSREAVKAHGGLVKTEEAARKKKTDKTSESPVNKVQVQTQAATGICILALPAEGTRSDAIQPKMDSAQPSTVSTALIPRAGLSAGVGPKPAKKAIAPGSRDVADVKPSNSPSLDEPASRKTATEASKAGVFPVILDDKIDSKSQTSVVAMATADLARMGVEGVGNKSVHAATAEPHLAGDGMHAPDVHVGAGILPASSAIDASMPLDVTHKTLQATPATLEVGLADGSRGWLKIRAEMADGGGVNASLSTASSSGQDLLHKELPSLTAYLQSEHIAVNRVIVQPAPAPVSDFRAFAGAMNNDGREQSRQSGSQGGENRQNASSPVLSRLERNRISGISESRADDLFSSFPYSGGGSWLSVRA